MDPKTIKNREEFEAEVSAPGRRVALFYSRGCPFCTSFMPDFDAQARAAAEPFLKLSTDELPELEDAFSVEVVPTVLCFEGGRLRSRLDGALGRGLNSEKLESFLKACRAGKQL